MIIRYFTLVALFPMRGGSELSRLPRLSAYQLSPHQCNSGIVVERFPLLLIARDVTRLVPSVPIAPYSCTQVAGALSITVALT